MRRVKADIPVAAQSTASAAPAAAAPAAAPAPAIQPAAVSEQARPRTEQATPAEMEAPAFESAVGASFWVRMPMVARIVLLVVALALFGLAAHRFIGGSSESAAKKAAARNVSAQAITMGPGSWFTTDMPDPTKARSRAGAFSIFRPSLELTDYRIEFAGRIEQNSLGWVVRFSDPDNYHAIKLTRQGGRLKLTRSVMLAGVVSSRQETALTQQAVGSKGHEVRMDVRGARFTVYLQGQQVDSWTDNRLTRGGFGFLNEGDERGRIDSIQVFLLSR
jgi:hypothetical protein